MAHVYFSLSGRNAKMPTKAYNAAAGFDLYASSTSVCYGHSVTKISTGVHVLLPNRTFGSIRDRSSLAIQGLVVVGGVIDPDYTGEIVVLINNTNTTTVVLQKGWKIAQLVIQHLTKIEAAVREDDLTDKRPCNCIKAKLVERIAGCTKPKPYTRKSKEYCKVVENKDIELQKMVDFFTERARNRANQDWRADSDSDLDMDETYQYPPVTESSTEEEKGTEEAATEDKKDTETEEAEEAKEGEKGVKTVTAEINKVTTHIILGEKINNKWVDRVPFAVTTINAKAVDNDVCDEAKAKKPMAEEKAIDDKEMPIGMPVGIPMGASVVGATGFCSIDGCKPVARVLPAGQTQVFDMRGVRGFGSSGL